MSTAYSIDDARESISKVLRRLIDIKRVRLNGSVKAALMEVSDQTGISVAYLNRAKKNIGESFAPHLHFAMRLNDALAEEVRKLEQSLAGADNDIRSLGEFWNGVGDGAATGNRDCCEPDDAGDPDD